MKKTTAFIVGIIVIAIGALSWSGFAPEQNRASPPDRITIGQPPLEQSALIYIAEDMGYFAGNGLDVTIRDDYPNGVLPVQDMIDGKVDLAVSAEYPVASAVIRGSNISVIAAIDKYQNEKILGRKDRGISEISDLRGKRIGYPKDTIVEFFLGRFLELNNVEMANVTLADVSASHAADAILGGEVDAIAYYQPYIAAMEARSGETMVSFPLQSNQLLYGVISSRNDWLASHPGQMVRFLQALAEADRYSISDPDGERTIVRRRLNMTMEYSAEVWPDHQFGLSLDQSLLIAMNDEARWMISNNLTQERTIPHYRQHISTTALSEVKPDAVNIR